MRVGLAVPSAPIAELGMAQMKRAVYVPLRTGMGELSGPVPLLSTAPGSPLPVR
jgi:hypothetical protein